MEHPNLARGLLESYRQTHGSNYAMKEHKTLIVIMTVASLIFLVLGTGAMGYLRWVLTTPRFPMINPGGAPIATDWTGLALHLGPSVALLSLGLALICWVAMRVVRTGTAET